MKKAIVVALSALVAISAAYSQDIDEGTAEGGKPAMSISVGPELAVSLSGAFAGVQAQFAWQPGFFGLVAGVRADAYLTRPDVYLIPSAGLRLGWFELTGGATFKVYDAPEPAGYIEASADQPSPFVRAGLAVPIGPVAVGLGARLMVADSYTESTAETVGEAIGEGIGAAIVAIFSVFQIDLGLSYRAAF